MTAASTTTYYKKMQKPIYPVLGLLILVSWGNFILARPNRIVVGYSATWRDEATPPQCYNYDAITYLARAFLAEHADGSIEVPDGYFNETMESLARAHGVKLLMSLGGEAEVADNWLSIARNPKYFERFYNNLDKLLADHHYDGIDIDWEPSATTTEDGLAYTTFMKNLRAHFPHQTITTALGASEYWIGHFNWKDITDNVDYVNVMTYDYSGGWGGRADFCSNLFPASVYKPQPTLSVAEGMTNLIENHKVPPAKLLLGMTFWPSRFAVNHIGDSFPKNGPGFSMNITYADAMCLLQTGKYADFWDDKAAAPYLERKVGGSVVVYENPRSIQRKCEYAEKLGCAGVMIWHLGADVDGDKAPLMDALAEACGVAKQRFPPEIQAQQMADREKESQKMKSRPEYVEISPDTAPPSHSFASDQTEWGLLQDWVWEKEAPQQHQKK
jgi:chitinase